MSAGTVEVYGDAGGEYRWRLKARNGRIIADSSEGYTSRRNAERAWKAVEKSIDVHPIVRHVGLR